jgi:hypothetical protein
MSEKLRLVKAASIGVALAATIPMFESEPQPTQQRVEAAVYYQEENINELPIKPQDLFIKSIGSLSISALQEQFSPAPTFRHDEASKVKSVASVQDIINDEIPRPLVDPKIDSMLNELAQCESRGKWDINTGNGYYGGLQFDKFTWRANGGKKFAPTADKASPIEQKQIAEDLYHVSGWRPWPGCARKLGWLE